MIMVMTMMATFIHIIIYYHNLLTCNISSYTKVKFNGLKIAEVLMHSLFLVFFLFFFTLEISLSLEYFCCTLCNSGSNIPEIFLGDKD